MKRAWILILISLVVVGFSGTARAELTVIGKATYEGRDYKLIYEDDQGLIWLDYSNRATNWYDQVSWAAGLNEPDVINYNLNPGISVTWKGAWWLPKTEDDARRFGYDGTTSVGFNITTSDLGHLYYESLDNRGYYDTEGNPGTGWYPDSNWGPKNTGPFDNLQPGMYWSGTEYSIAPLHAWAFNFVFGHQGNKSFKSSYPYWGIAARPGIVKR